MEEEIPNDIMKAACAAHADFARSSVTDNLSVIIGKAILAERERCARVIYATSKATANCVLIGPSFFIFLACSRRAKSSSLISIMLLRMFSGTVVISTMEGGESTPAHLPLNPHLLPHPIKLNRHVIEGLCEILPRVAHILDDGGELRHCGGKRIEGGRIDDNGRDLGG